MTAHEPPAPNPSRERDPVCLPPDIPMSTNEHNPPAFPVSPFATDGRNWSDGSEGMTLRDYFAAAALQSLLGPTMADGARHRQNPDKIMEQAIRGAWIAADEMLKQRGTQP